MNNTSFPLYPLIETNRNCPYQCHFCVWGDFDLTKIRVFDFDTVIEELRYIVKNSKKNVSSHAGTIVHMSPAFGIEFVDIIKKKKNNEYDRWIPLISNYKRINFEEINEKYLENFEI